MKLPGRSFGLVTFRPRYSFGPKWSAAKQIGTPHTVPPVGLMTWADILALRREGVRFGSHLASLTSTDRLSSWEVTIAAACSRAVLEARLGEPVHSVAVPFGILDERLGRVLACCGYKVGLSARAGLARLDDDPLNLPRIAVCGDWDEETFLKYLDFEGDVVAGGGR